ncbi:DUF1642 domain-containing protein [Lactococcus lactis]|uniref:DUF1642 domain-containing protein n=1 Tax=Lactococcus lactis TaxID=1358 RepID=UPI000559B5EE|nr:DUF1642 domain-containing protein [Lactococcus lactis]AJA57203.1 hypothetical protein QI18_07235 [Lactococcus lactis subsp. lactis]WBM76596.1 DUF1642 domain-containing protein [Lactococcus lactis]WSP31065.1 DUF1642 domain-containing protein [Lactococcus lactis subsp. lactis]
MTKFEEELYNKVKVTNIELTTEAEYKKSTLINHFKDWHSDEEFQIVEEIGGSFALANKNLIDANTKLAEEIANLKSQLQQQALPVVPECVGLRISEDIEHNTVVEDILTIIITSDDKDLKEYGLWIKKNPVTYVIARTLGYQVEKPQLFKLIFPNSTTVLQKDGELNSFADTVYKRYLIGNAMTEQEIKSIDERYWQFAVPVEDGE